MVGFEETNLSGNVYYVNHVRWQGRCREMFLREHAPEVLEDLAHGLLLFTKSCSCEYVKEVSAFDEILVRMRLGDMTQSELTLLFEYSRITDDREEPIARGEQKIACRRREAAGTVAAPLPKALAEALRHYSVF